MGNVTNPMNKLQLFKKGKAYKYLMKKYKPNDMGLWIIWSEDQTIENHIAPNHKFLGVFEGKLQHVIEVAVTIDNFWFWDDGGYIEKTCITPITAQTALIRKNRQNKIAELESQLKTLKEEDSELC